ncbi:hypothetical protein BX616_001144, partial [Lobosporangium transversale]
MTSHQSGSTRAYDFDYHNNSYSREQSPVDLHRNRHKGPKALKPSQLQHIDSDPNVNTLSNYNLIQKPDRFLKVEEEHVGGMDRSLYKTNATSKDITNLDMGIAGFHRDKNDDGQGNLVGAINIAEHCRRNTATPPPFQHQRIQHSRSHYGYDLLQKLNRQEQQQQEAQYSSTRQESTDSQSTAMMHHDRDKETSRFTPSPTATSMKSRPNGMSSSAEVANTTNNSVGSKFLEQTNFTPFQSQTPPQQFQHDTRNRSGSAPSKIIQRTSTFPTTSMPSMPISVSVLLPPSPRVQQQQFPSPGRSVISDIQCDVSLPTKTRWEYDESISPIASTPDQEHFHYTNETNNSNISHASKREDSSETGSRPHTPQRSSSIFDFLRFRKFSIPKSSSQHHQAAAQVASVVNATSAASTSGSPGRKANFPLLDAPPPIAKSRMSGLSFGSLIPQPTRKQSLDAQAMNVCQTRAAHTSSSQGLITPGGPILSSVSAPSISDSGWYLPPTQIHSLADHAPSFNTGATTTPVLAMTASPTSTPVPTPVAKPQSTLSKVAAAVASVTVGKRRPSVVSGIEPGKDSSVRHQSIAGYKTSGYDSHRSSVGSSWLGHGHGPGLDQEQLSHHVIYMKSEIEKLEETLSNSQEEAMRLRNRLLSLEYDNSYVGLTAFLPGNSDTNNNSNDNNNNNNNNNNNSNSINNSEDSFFSEDTIQDSGSPSVNPSIGYGPITIAAHKRRSDDSRIMERKSQALENQVHDLKRLLETEKQNRQRDLMEFRRKMHEKCAKLERELQAAK